MDDTSPEVKKLVHEKLMRLSGEERFIMGCQMFDSAREIILASFPRDLPPDQLKERLYERVYGAPLRKSPR